MIGLIYLRVSTDDQEGGLEMQRSITKKICDKLDISVVGTYQDVAISGASRNRQGLNDLKAQILKLKLLDSDEELALVVYDISRIARDVTIGEEMIQLCRKYKVAIIDREGNIKRINTAYESLALRVGFVFATTDKEVKNENCINGMTEAMLSGRWERKPPKGYSFQKTYIEKLGRKASLIVPNDDAPIVKEALEQFADGILTTPFAVMHWLATKSLKIDKDRIKYFLCNPLYVGMLEYPQWKISLRPALHKPIISLETHQKILARFESKQKKIYKTNSMEDFPLRRFTKCSQCEHYLSACWLKNRTVKSYFCHNKKCTIYKKHINGKVLETNFVRLLETVKLPTFILSTARELFDLEWSYHLKGLENTKNKAKNDYEKIDRQIENIFNRLKNCEIEIIAKKYEKEITDLENQKVILKVHLQELTADELETQLEYQTSLTKAMVLLEKPHKIWSLGGLKLKHLVFSIVFDGYILVNPVDLYLTPNFSSVYQLFSQIESQKSFWCTNLPQITNHSGLGEQIEAKLLSLVLSIHPHVQHVEEGEWNRVFELLNLNNILC